MCTFFLKMKFYLRSDVGFSLRLCTIWLFVIILSGCKSISKHDSLDCGLIMIAINNKAFAMQFSICGKNEPLFIFDQTKSIKNCEYQVESCDKVRNVVLTNDRKYDSISPGAYQDGVDKNLIILHSVEVTKDEYKLYFWKPLTGAFVNLFYEKQSEIESYKLVKSSTGAF